MTIEKRACENAESKRIFLLVEMVQRTRRCLKMASEAGSMLFVIALIVITFEIPAIKFRHTAELEWIDWNFSPNIKNGY